MALPFLPGGKQELDNWIDDLSSSSGFRQGDGNERSVDPNRHSHDESGIYDSLLGMIIQDSGMKDMQDLVGDDSSEVEDLRAKFASDGDWRVPVLEGNEVSVHEVAPSGVEDDNDVRSDAGSLSRESLLVERGKEHGGNEEGGRFSFSPIHIGGNTMMEDFLSEAQSVTTVEHGVDVMQNESVTFHQIASSFVDEDKGRRLESQSFVSSVINWAVLHSDSSDAYRRHHAIIDALLYYVQQDEQSYSRSSVLESLLRISCDGEDSVKLEISKKRKGIHVSIRQALPKLIKGGVKWGRRKVTSERYLKCCLQETAKTDVSCQLLYVGLAVWYVRDTGLQLPTFDAEDVRCAVTKMTSSMVKQSFVMILYIAMLVSEMEQSMFRDWRMEIYGMLSGVCSAGDLFTHLDNKGRVDLGPFGLMGRFMEGITQAKVAEALGNSDCFFHVPSDEKEFRAHMLLCAYFAKTSLLKKVNGRNWCGLEGTFTEDVGESSVSLGEELEGESESGGSVGEGTGSSLEEGGTVFYSGGSGGKTAGNSNEDDEGGLSNADEGTGSVMENTEKQSDMDETTVVQLEDLVFEEGIRDQVASNVERVLIVERVKRCLESLQGKDAAMNKRLRCCYDECVAIAKLYN